MAGGGVDHSTFRRDRIGVQPRRIDFQSLDAVARKLKRISRFGVSRLLYTDGAASVVKKKADDKKRILRARGDQNFVGAHSETTVA